jgi:hypothetical protein
MHFRFFALYFQYYYNLIFKNKIFLFLSILGYDIIWLGIIALCNILNNPWLGLIIGLLISIATMILAVLILAKIYKLMKMIDKTSIQTSTYKNMQAAALMCLLEGFVGILLNVPIIYKNVFALTVSRGGGTYITVSREGGTYVYLCSAVTMEGETFLLKPKNFNFPKRKMEILKNLSNPPPNLDQNYSGVPMHFLFSAFGRFVEMLRLGP